MSYLYRYRAFPARNKSLSEEADKEYQKKLKRLRLSIVKNRHCMVSPAWINDPFDCKPHFNTEKITLSDVRRLIEIAQNYTDRRLSPGDINNMVEIMREHPDDMFNLIEKVMKAFREDSKRLAILSFTTKPDDVLMWSHYADSHRGICLQFDKELLADVSPGKQLLDEEYGLLDVEYDDNMRLLNEFASEELATQFIKSSMTRKAREWRYEDEWRLIAGDHKDVSKAGIQITLVNNSLTGIVFGCDIPADHRELVRQWLSETTVNKDVKCYQARKSRTEYALEVLGLEK
jgi:hypothetical protein